MADDFGFFSSSESGAAEAPEEDPAAAFLAQQESEIAGIENDEGFGAAEGGLGEPPAAEQPGGRGKGAGTLRCWLGGGVGGIRNGPALPLNHGRDGAGLLQTREREAAAGFERGTTKISRFFWAGEKAPGAPHKQGFRGVGGGEARLQKQPLQRWKGQRVGFFCIWGWPSEPYAGHPLGQCCLLLFIT